MADGEVLVTFATIQAAAEQTASTNQTIQRLLQDLYQQLQPIYASWSGAASEGFQYQHQRWVAAAGDLNTVLQHISTVLSDSHDGYTRAESAARQFWGD